MLSNNVTLAAGAVVGAAAGGLVGCGAAVGVGWAQLEMIRVSATSTPIAVHSLLFIAGSS
jgi:hypothetical protein